MISFCYTKKSSGNISFTTDEHRFQHILKLLLQQILWLVCCTTVVPYTKWFKYTTSKLIYMAYITTHIIIYLYQMLHIQQLSVS
jgi:hypothetical protein